MNGATIRFIWALAHGSVWHMDRSAGMLIGKFMLVFDRPSDLFYLNMNFFQEFAEFEGCPH